MHLIHFPPVPGTKMQEIMGAAYRGGAHVTLPPWHDDVEANGDVVRAVAAGGSGQEKRVRDDAVKEVAITTHEDDARWRKVCVDGSIVELPKGGSIRVRTLERGPFYVLVDRVGDR